MSKRRGYYDDIRIEVYDHKVVKVVPSDVTAYCKECGKEVRGIIRDTNFVCRHQHHTDVSPLKPNNP